MLKVLLIVTQSPDDGWFLPFNTDSSLRTYISSVFYTTTCNNMYQIDVNLWM